jgi:hypothetical protein
MGYYSQVGLALTEKAYITLLEALKKDKEYFSEDNYNEILNLINKNVDIHYHEHTKEKLLIWNWIKWYNSYASVNYINDFVKSLNTEDYLYIIIEEDGNLTVDGEFYDNIFGLSWRSELEYSLYEITKGK